MPLFFSTNTFSLFPFHLQYFQISPPCMQPVPTASCFFTPTRLFLHLIVNLTPYHISSLVSFSFFYIPFSSSYHYSFLPSFLLQVELTCPDPYLFANLNNSINITCHNETLNWTYVDPEDRRCRICKCVLSLHLQSVETMTFKANSAVLLYAGMFTPIIFLLLLISVMNS